MNQVGLGRVGPAQSDLLIHFCGRPSNSQHNDYVSLDIQNASADVRLDRILTSGHLKGFPQFGADADQPTVCFSESPSRHLEYLLNCGWKPWRLLFHRQWVYDQGGEPVAYMRKARWDRRLREDKPWAVRLEADPLKGWSEWMHEREWRILLNPDQPYLTLTPDAIAAILVGYPFWEPTPGDHINMITGELSDGSSPSDEPLPNSLWVAVPKWSWSPGTGLSVLAI